MMMSCQQRWMEPQNDKRTSLALRLVLSDHVAIPHESQPDLLTEAEQAFVSKKPKAVKTRTTTKNPKPSAVKASGKRAMPDKKSFKRRLHTPVSSEAISSSPSTKMR
jgi:hypothetical protein